MTAHDPTGVGASGPDAGAGDAGTIRPPDTSEPSTPTVTPSVGGADLGEPSVAAGADDASGADVARLEAERNEYLELARRVQAEFENYRKRVDRQMVEHRERAAEELVRELLPVLDACEAAVSHGVEGVDPIHASLLGVLEKGGLTRVGDVGTPFDPSVHEAVMHEPGDGAEPSIAQVLRTGYLWNSHVVRPAMVKVRG